MKKIATLLLAALFVISVKAQEPIITGKVINEKSEGVAHALISVLNSNITVSADNQGRFTIRAGGAGTYTLLVSALGYAKVSQEVTAGDRENNLVIKLDEESRRLDEVVITSQKREESLQKAPLSITVLSGEEVEAYKLWNLKNITAIVPNLYSANSGDNRNVISIRGIATTSYDQAAAVYIDGVNQFSLDTYIAQLQDIERIEVIRGPQGTLYGRNAMGGVINVITRRPGGGMRGSFETALGNYGLERYNLALSGPLVKNKLFLGASGLYTKNNGYYTNDFTDGRYDKQNTFMGNYYVKFLPSENLALTLNVKHNSNRNHGAFPLASNMEEAFAKPYVLNQNAVTLMKDNTFNSSLALNYTSSAFNFSSHTSYQSNLRYYTGPIDGDFSPLDMYSIINDYGKPWNKVEAAAQEFKFSSPASASRVRWTAGLYFFHQNNPVKQGTYFGKDIAMMSDEIPPGSTNVNINKGKSAGAAFFADASYRLSSKFEAGIGLRYDYEHKRQTVRGEFLMDGMDAMAVQPDTSASADFNAFSPKVSLSYYPSADHVIYTAYNRGFRAGGLTQYSGDPSQPALYVYKPEFSNNIEVGSKNTFFDNKLRLNLTAFYTRLTDAQIPSLILPDAVTVIRNAGELTSRGVEAELAAAPVRNIHLSYNFGYTHAEYTDFTTAADGAAVNLSGNRQIFSPDITSMSALQYAGSLSRQKKLHVTIRGEWQYLGDQFFDPANMIKQEGYNIFNVRAGLSFKQFEISFWGNNLSNKSYIDYAYDFGAVHLGNPRTYGTMLKVKFN